MADPIGMAEHRDAGVVLDEANQFVAAPGDDQIHEAIQTQQRQALLTCGEQREGIGRHRTGRKTCLQGFHHGLVGAARLTAPFNRAPLPERIARDAICMTASGLASKITPTTPSGTETRSRTNP